MSSLLVACSEPAPQGGEYFDQITPVPGTNQAQTAPSSEVPTEQSSEPQDYVETDAVVYVVGLQTGIQFDPVVNPRPNREPAVNRTPPAAAPGLYEPALSVPQETAKSKKRAASPPKAVALKPRQKSLNLQEYAATQRHLVGEQKYSRSKSKYASGGNCDQYSIPEIAQVAFLNAGGPRKDDLLLDADGDGFACAWVPQR